MKRLAVFIVFFMLNYAAYCQVANDECATAITLIPSASCAPVSGTLLNATTSAITAGCSGNRDVFYQFTAVSSSATITVASSSGLDVVVGLLGYCSSLTSLYCMDLRGNGGTETISATGLTTGATYYIKIQAYSTYVPSTYTFTVCVASAGTVTSPANDQCNNAQALTTNSLCNSVAGTLLNATTSGNSTGCNGFYYDVFYKFTANASSATISVQGSTGLDAVVNLFTACTNGTSLYCVDNWGNGGTEIINASGLVPGSVYYISVQSYWQSPPTYTFNICVQSVSTAIPPNDNCVNAIRLAVSPTCTATAGTLLNATNSSLANSCDGSNDVFYSFEATDVTATVSIVPSTDMDVAIGVYESCDGANINCTDASGIGGAESAVLTGLVAGNVYIVQVQKSVLTSSVSGDFSICVIGAEPPPPLNDECAGAFEITPTVAYNPITGDVKKATISTITPSCTGNSDVFYKFTATAKTAAIKVIGSSGFDPVIGLFKACGTPYVDCADYDYNVGGTETLNPTNLIVGTTYYIKVQDYNTTLPTTFTFTVAVQSAEVATGIDASQSLLQVRLFPNPAQNILNIENIQMETVVELIDIQGKVLLQKSISADGSIDVSGFAAGIYVLKLSVDGVIENRRVVITQ